MCLLECKYKESLPLTNMRYKSGRVESIVLHRKVEDFFHGVESEAANGLIYGMERGTV